ncbi:hypothetical protein CBR_g45429 [Chara braunii]|uniref:Uncharacterized protein n=1 Tax=Chara braunii TaxID=69332 RepID=A0A388LYG1_CHABU|nr:hypothetical protein CBR_g45429 [Chara braunii]|eukprot:GBG87370.1 hypothetical protein CBR_g45429 [Chara braunii]
MSLYFSTVASTRGLNISTLLGSTQVVLGATSGRICVGAEDLVAIVVVADVGLVPHAAQLVAAGFGVVPPALAPVVAAAVVAAALTFLAAAGFGDVPPTLAPVVAAPVVAAALAFAVGIVVVAVVGIVPHAAQLGTQFVVAGFGSVPPVLAPVVVAPAVAAALTFAVGIAHRGALGLVVAVLAGIIGIVPHTAPLVVFECAAVAPWLALVVAAVPTGVAPAAEIASAVGFAVGHAPPGSFGIVAALVAIVVDNVLLAAQLAVVGCAVVPPGLARGTALGKTVHSLAVVVAVVLWWTANDLVVVVAVVDSIAQPRALCHWRCCSPPQTRRRRVGSLTLAVLLSSSDRAAEGWDGVDREGFWGSLEGRNLISPVSSETTSFMRAGDGRVVIAV